MPRKRFDSTRSATTSSISGSAAGPEGLDEADRVGELVAALLRRVCPLCPSSSSVASRAAAREPVERRGEVRARQRVERGRLAAEAAQLVVGAADEVAQDRPLPGRGEREPWRVGLGEQLVERVLERALGEQVRLDRVEHPEARVDAGGDRVRREQPAAEAMDRRQPGAGRARQLAQPPRPAGVAELLRPRGAAPQLGAHPAAQLARPPSR